jgi:hypothetical protein
MSDADGAVLALKDRPLDFVETEYVLYDTKTKVAYWVTGFFNYGVFKPADYKFSLWGQIKFMWALKEWRRKWLIYQNEQAQQKNYQAGAR